MLLISPVAFEPLPLPGLTCLLPSWLLRWRPLKGLGLSSIRDSPEAPCGMRPSACCGNGGCCTALGLGALNGGVKNIKCVSKVA